MDWWRLKLNSGGSSGSGGGAGSSGPHLGLGVPDETREQLALLVAELVHWVLGSERVHGCKEQTSMWQQRACVVKTGM